MVTLTPALATVLVLLVGLSVAAVSLTRLPLAKSMVTAAGRAGAQLAVVSALLVLVFDSIIWTLVYVACMFGVAAATSAGRLRISMSQAWTAVPIAAGAVPVLGLVMGSGTVPWKPSGVLPIAGILLGGAMTATTLAGQRMFDELHRRRGEYEAALCLGMVPRDAVVEVARDAAGLALVPALDQTRTVGLVTLPGAFVGVLLGGGSAAAAGAAQALILIGLLAAESIAVLVTVKLVAGRRLMPAALALELPV
jgi:putative ABC transport system permease protein